jgi:hypothetical protein
MGATRRSLQVQSKILKKIIRTPNLPIRTKICLKKEKEPKKNSYGSYPTECAGSTQNPKKIIETSNLPIRTKNFPKKLCFVP